MAQLLKDRISDERILGAPGVYDGLSATLAARAGFEAVYMTGYGTAAAHGYPDLGLLTLTEMVRTAGCIASTVDVPVIADADTGYGDTRNVARTVREYERAGVAALHLEDQDWPKKCGRMEDKRLVSTGEMADKIKAAVDSRTRDDLLIIARTDAIAVEGFDAAIDRAQAYADAGADVLFVEAPEDRHQVEAIPKRIPARPHLISLAPRTPSLSVSELENLGYRIAIYPGICLVAAITAGLEQLHHLQDTGEQQNLEQWSERFAEFNAMLARTKGIVLND